MQSRSGRSATVLPIGERVPVTLQVVLGGSDGILIASDTKASEFLVGASMLAEPNRKFLDVGKTRTSSLGAQKVLFNRHRTIAVACSGADLTDDVGRTIVDEVESVWSDFSGPLEDLCRSRWKKLPSQDRRAAVEGSGENTLILVHSGRQESYKIRFGVSRVQVRQYVRTNGQRFSIQGGDTLNPAGFLIQRYLPASPPRIDSLATLAAYYILAGAELNSGGIGGLRMHFARDGEPFESVTDGAIADLHERFGVFNQRISDFLLQPTEL